MNTRITYTPRPDATTETELDVLAAVYRFILDCHAKKEGSPALATLDNDGRIKGDTADESIIRH